MKIAAADDERLALNRLIQSIEDAEPDAEIKSFIYQSELIAEIDEGFAPDVAFLDIEMPGMSGMELAKYIKAKSPDTAIVFVTGYPDYALEAYRLHARGFVTKPATAAKIREELDNLGAVPALQQAPAKRIRVQCFGNFEVFADGVPLQFARSRSKELFAFLVDRRGAAVSMPEIAAVLWDDGQYSLSRNNQIHNFLTDLTKALAAAGEENIILRKRNSLAVDTEAFDCDYYSCLNGDPAGINAYCEEYMTQYSWAEFTTAELTNKYSY